MEYIAIVIYVALSIATTIITKPVCRDEDIKLMSEKSVDVILECEIWKYISWVFTCVYGAVSFVFRVDTFIQMEIIIIGIFAGVYCLVKVYMSRKTYFTSDDERLTYIKKGELMWSYTWKDITHVNLLPKQGYTMFIADGTCQSNLPSCIIKVFQKHGLLEKGNKVIKVAIFMVFAICFLIMFYVIFHLE